MEQKLVEKTPEDAKEALVSFGCPEDKADAIMASVEDYDAGSYFLNYGSPDADGLVHAVGCSLEDGEYIVEKVSVSWLS